MGAGLGVGVSECAEGDALAALVGEGLGDILLFFFLARRGEGLVFFFFPGVALDFSSGSMVLFAVFARGVLLGFGFAAGDRAGLAGFFLFGFGFGVGVSSGSAVDCKNASCCDSRGRKPCPRTRDPAIPAKAKAMPNHTRKQITCASVTEERGRSSGLERNGTCR